LCIYETVLITKERDTGFLTDYTFIADTGDSSPMVHIKKYLTNIEKVDTYVTAWTDDFMQCKEKETFRDYMVNQGGRRILVCLQDVLYVPELKVNLLSITTEIEMPSVSFKASSENFAIYLNGKEIKFLKHLEHGSGRLYATDIIPQNKEAVLNYGIWQNKQCFGTPSNAILKKQQNSTIFS
jgi:hypothetical protein